MRTQICITIVSLMSFLHPLIAEENKIITSHDIISQDVINEPGAVIFTPPENWRMADSIQLPPSVKIMVVGKGNSDYPPSINLATEKFKGNLREYLKIVKKLNDTQGAQWKDLGKIRTEAGNASLSQVDLNTEWGPVKLTHVIMVKSGTAYILTSASLKEEFPTFYKDFFTAMRSLRINKSIFEMVSNSKKRTDLQEAYQQVKEEWRKKLKEKNIETTPDQLFANEQFQKSSWLPFEKMLTTKFNDMDQQWKNYVLVQLKNELFEEATIVKS